MRQPIMVQDDQCGLEVQILGHFRSLRYSDWSFLGISSIDAGLFIYRHCPSH